MYRVIFHHKPLTDNGKFDDKTIYIDNTKSEYDHRIFSEIAGFKILYDMVINGRFKNDDWLSLNHYRRIFDDKDVYNRTCVPEVMILQTSVAGHYSIYHNLDDLILCGQALKEEFPHLVQGFEQVINGNVFIPYNMAILTAAQFKDYCDFLFKI